MVSFIHNGTVITTWMRYSFKTTSAKSKVKQHFSEKNIFLNLKQQIIGLAQGQWSCMPTHSNSYFCSCFCKKNIFSSSFYQRVLFCKFADKKVVGSMSKYYLLARDRSQVSIFSLHKIKISKQHRFIL